MAFAAEQSEIERKVIQYAAIPQKGPLRRTRLCSLKTYFESV